MKTIRHWWRGVAVDTVALLVFSLIAGAATLFYEMYIVGMSFSQWGAIRLIYNPLRILGARVCGKITDKLREKMLGGSKNPLRKAAVDTLALSVFQTPIYILSCILVGATFTQICIMVGLSLVDNVLFGWLYGVILDFFRKKLGNRSRKP